MKTIILDTNILLAIFELKLDLFSELDRVCLFNYRVCILDVTLDEVEKLINGSTLQQRQAARSALQLIRKKELKIIVTPKNALVDDLLLQQKHAIIATADRELKRRLRNAGMQIISIRQKKYLMLEPENVL